MKSAIFASVFAIGALAQVSTITDALSTIQSDTQALDQQVTSYSGGSITSLQSAATALINAINSGNSAVAGIAILSLNDAVTLVAPIGALSSEVTTATNDVISAKSTFDSANEGYDVLQNLQSLSSATSTFAATVLSKLPSSLASEGQSLAAPITAALQKAVAAYQGETPPTSSSSSASSSVSSATGTSSSLSSATVTSSSLSTSSSTATNSGTPSGVSTTTSGLSTITSSSVTTTTSAIGTVTPISNSTTSTLSPFNAAPTAAAGYGVIALAAFGAIVAL